MSENSDNGWNPVIATGFGLGKNGKILVDSLYLIFKCILWISIHEAVKTLKFQYVSGFGVLCIMLKIRLYFSISRLFMIFQSKICRVMYKYYPSFWYEICYIIYANDNGFYYFFMYFEKSACIGVYVVVVYTWQLTVAPCVCLGTNNAQLPFDHTGNANLDNWILENRTTYAS